MLEYLLQETWLHKQLQQQFLTLYTDCLMQQVVVRLEGRIAAE